MQIGKFKSLTEMARKSTHNAEFVDNLKSATSEVFDQAMDKLLINKAASSEDKLAVLENLKDLRQAILVSVKKPEAARTANIKSAIQSRPSKSEIAEALPLSEPGTKAGTTIEREVKGTYLVGPSNGREIASNGRLHYQEDFQTENFDNMTGPKNFLVGLSNVIGLASAVAALPPGPMAMSVGTMAKEEAFSNHSSQSSGGSSSVGSSSVLLGLGGMSAHSAASSHQSSASGTSGYSRESTDERLATSIQELDFHMEQAESRPANQGEVKIKYSEEVYEEKEVSTWGGLSSKTIRERASYSNSEYKLHSTNEFEPDRLWLPETGTSEFT